MTVSSAPAAAIVWPKAHLTRSPAASGAENAAERSRFGVVGIDGAIAMRGDQSDLTGTDSGVIQRQFNRARLTVAVGADAQDSAGFGRDSAA